MAFASRMKNIEMSGIRKMFDLATEKSINLGLGEPDFNPPQSAIEGLKNAISTGRNKYGPTAGIPELRAAVAEMSRKYKKDLTAENVIITGSASEALMATALTFIDCGDEVLYPEPGFVLYKPQIQLSCGTGIPYPLEKEHDFVPQIDTLNELITSKTKAIIVNSPSNPTGTVFDADTVKAITELAEDHEMLIISDEVYDKMVYDREHCSFLGDYNNVIYVNSFSKIYAMTGWRLGYIITDSSFIKTLLIAHYHVMACPATPIEHGALAAIRGPQTFVAEMVKEFRKRRDLIVNKLNDIDGFSCLMPQGAFYAFPSYEHDIKSVDLALKLVHAGVICSPGTAFGPKGEGHLRFSYAASTDAINKGIDIVARVTGEL